MTTEPPPTLLVPTPFDIEMTVRLQPKRAFGINRNGRSSSPKYAVHSLQHGREAQRHHRRSEGEPTHPPQRPSLGFNAKNSARRPAMMMAVEANCPKWTAVQVVLAAYSAKTAGWLLAASRPGCNRPISDTSSPTNRSAAARRSDLPSGMTSPRHARIARAWPATRGARPVTPSARAHAWPYGSQCGRYRVTCQGGPSARSV
jgi:hypothetical protein